MDKIAEWIKTRCEEADRKEAERRAKEEAEALAALRKERGLLLDLLHDWDFPTEELDWADDDSASLDLPLSESGGITLSRFSGDTILCGIIRCKTPEALAQTLRRAEIESKED